MDIIQEKLNNLLKELLIASKDFKSQSVLLKNKKKLLEDIDEIISLYKKIKNEI